MSVPLEVVHRIKEREGFRVKVYADTATPPKLTAGWGHELVGGETRQWPIGARVTLGVVLGWFRADSQRAYDVATSLAQRIGFNDPRLVNALTSVCFQLGGVWYKEFKLTWAHLLSHEWDQAAAEVQRSKWFRQTPVRVHDFQEALRSLDLPLPATFVPAAAAAEAAAPINNGGAHS